MTDPRRHHLSAQRERLCTLEGCSSILRVEHEGTAPQRYTLRFRGRGLCRDRTHGGLVLADDHQCSLRLPYAFPQTGPDIQWLTPLVHPNISFSGLVQLEDLGLPWNPRMGLEVVCERLWDAVRLAYVDWQRVVNEGAAYSLQRDCAWALPLDTRPLRDRDRRSVINLVRYRRAAARHAEQGAQREQDLFVIDEHTMARPMESPELAAPDRDDILYIGDDPASSS